MGGFLIKRYVVLVSGFPEHVYYAASPGKARAQAWRDYGYADQFCDFKRFLRISTIRVDTRPPPPRFGEEITVAGARAYWVKSNGHYVSFVRSGKDTILLSHPNDVTTISAKSGVL